MSSKLISAVARLLSLPPLAANQAIGAMAGRLAWWLNSRSRRITESNLQLCFPSMDGAERQELAKRSLLQTGIQFTECAWIWHRPTQQLNSRILQTHGQDLLEQAIASERGVIIVSPHIGNWELCSLPIAQHAPFTYFYRSPRNPAMDPLLIKWRAHLGGQPASLDTGGIRDGLRILKKGGVVGILPDQEPDRANGVFAPFFGQAALTMTLLPKLARRSGAHVLLCVSERLPQAAGWRVHFLRASDEIASQDLEVAAAAVNRDVERCIALCMEQYLWDYKRFNTLQDGTRRNYSGKP